MINPLLIAQMLAASIETLRAIQSYSAGDIDENQLADKADAAERARLDLKAAIAERKARQ